MKLLAFVVLLIPVVLSKKRYDGYKVLQVTPNTDVALKKLSLTLPNPVIKVDVWKPFTKVGKYADIMVGPDHYDELMEYLKRLDATVKVGVEDVQRMIDVEATSKSRWGTGPFALDQYHSHDEINAWLESLAGTYSSFVSTFSVGTSKEGRDMKAIKIGKPGTNKPGFWLDAGIHAREWVAPATALYIINELVTKYSSDATYKSFVDGIDFYILPSANPDGYEYSRNTDRLWRKTRGGPYCKKDWWGNNKCCYGADPNRNWDFHWQDSGTSTDPCDETYGGPNAFSEVECKQMADWLTAHASTLQSYISLHSYSDLWMYGYGYASNTYPPDVEELKTLSYKAATAIKNVHGVEYDVGSPTDILYAASGASDDWAKGVAKIKWTYTLELRPGSSDPDNDQSYGFQLPAKYITPTAEESWAGIQVVVQKILNP